MKKFRMYLSENGQEEVYSAYDAIDLIKKNCKHYIDKFLSRGSSYLDYTFYRGMIVDLDHPYFVEKRVRKDRKPSDTAFNLHKFLDQWFYDNFGIYARSQCLFVTKDYYFAKEFPTDHASKGKQKGVYVIFPIGEFDWIYSPDVKDMYTEFDMSSSNIREFVNSKLEDFEEHFTHKEIKEIIDSSSVVYDLKTFETPEFSEIFYSRYLEDRDFKKNVVPGGGINSEIMIDCDRYYAWDYNKFNELGDFRQRIFG